MNSTLKKVVPRPVKRWLRGAYRDRAFVRQVQRLHTGNVPGPDELARLSAAWGNDDFSADVAYLRRVCELAVSTPGPILECGSGLTTVLLSIVAGRNGAEIFALEHLPEWGNRLQNMLARCDLPARVELCRLRTYDDFDWYELPRRIPDQFRLVICDGPPGTTRGGRYGLLPVCARRLSEDCTILLDDVQRPEERAIVQRWQGEFGVATEVLEAGSGAFAEIRLRAGSAFQCDSIPSSPLR